MFSNLLSVLVGYVSPNGTILYCSVALVVVSALFFIRFIYRLFD